MNVIKISFLIIILALIIAVNPQNSNGEQQKESPWLVYNINRNRIYKSVKVHIFNSNTVLVSIEKYQEKLPSYWFKLNEKEMTTLRMLITSTQFLSPIEPRSNQPERCMHAGISTLTITLEGKTNKSQFCFNEILKPLTQHLWLMINQAVIHNKLEKDNDLYAVLGAVSPQTASDKVLQPQTFIEPLRGQIESAEAYQKLSWGLQALSWLIAPHEFSEYVSNILDHLSLDRESLWLETLSQHEFYGNLSKSSSAALLPIFLDKLKKNYHPPQNYGYPNDSSYYKMINLLGYKRFTQAIPYLLELVKKNDKPYAEAQLFALPIMGEPALEHIQSILDNDRSIDKIVGAEMLVISSRLNPKAGYSNPVSEDEFIRIRNRLTEEFIPLLKEMAENDTNKKVRESAQKAIEDIKLELKK